MRCFIDKFDFRAYFIVNFSLGAEVLKKKETIMVEVTESATKQIAEYFKGKDVTPIRIFLNSGG